MTACATFTNSQDGSYWTRPFTVSQTGTYNIFVQGASGGGSLGGAGAYEEAYFYLQAGDVLSVAVGVTGFSGGSYYGSGGGGASWVWKYGSSSRPSNPLIVAGGGGGSGGGCLNNGLKARYTTTTGLPLGGHGGNTAGGGGGAGAGGTGWTSSGGGIPYSMTAGLASYKTYGGYFSDVITCGQFYGNVHGGDSDWGGDGGRGGGGGGGAFTYAGDAPKGGGGGGGGGYYGGKGGAGVGIDGGGYGGGSYINSSYSLFQSAGYGSSTGCSAFVSFTFVDTSNLTCYLPGTLILTTRGEVAVEDLKINDLLPTLSGEKVPIKWVGIQQFMGQYATKDASPVRFHMGSLGNGLPKRDLYVSAGHSMKIGEHLVDARLLVNGVTITQHQRFEQLEYYHIDLGEHHCILAEGAWSESYLECNANRETFVNADEFYATHPYHLTHSVLEKCLPHVADYRDPRHPALFKTLLAHIPADRVTTDPDLHLLADGKRLDPYEFVPHAFMFRVPAGTQVLRLRSRTSRPCDLGLPADDRQLGFCVQSLTTQSEDGTVKIVVEPHHAQLLEGFHRPEGTQRRWTQGDALLPKMLLGDGAEDMTLTIKGRALACYHLGDVEVRDEHTTLQQRAAR